MKITYKLCFIIIFCLSQQIIYAQALKGKTKLDSQKIAFYTSKIELTVEESKDFWAVYNEMENEIKALKSKNAHGKMILINKKYLELSDYELEEILDSKLKMGKDLMDIKIKYHEKFKEILSIQKVAKYYQSTREFKKIQSERKKQHSNPGERKR
jgi:hypothetical protein